MEPLRARLTFYENLLSFSKLCALSLCEARFFMRKEITIVIKNRMHSNVVLMALLAAGFEKVSDERLHDGLHLHLKPPVVK